MSQNIDELDREILTILQQDARTSYIRIAKSLKVSEATIRNRVARLEKTGIIKKYSIMLDLKKIGLNGVAIIGIDVEPSAFLHVAMTLTQMSETVSVRTSSGDHMIICEVWTKDGKELDRFINERLGALQGITKICPAVINEEYKI